MTSRTALSIKEKLNLIKEIEEDHKEKKEMCLKYKCDISTVNRILKKKFEIYEAASINSKQKRNRRGVHDNVEKALWIWYNKQKEEDATSVSSQMILRKAKEIAIKLGQPFEPGHNWLFRWKRRFNINLGAIHNEASDNDSNVPKTCTDNILHEIIKKYSEANIMSAAETALFYKALPTRNYLRPDMQPYGQKSQKERFTLLFICDAAATFKRVYAVGKSNNPSFLKNVKPPVPYFSNEKALMTTTLWQEIIHSLDIEMQKLNRKIVLFVDNDKYHKVPHLTNVLVKFIPLNCKILTQPLDQGLISSFKAHYRQIIVKKQISALERDMTLKDFYKSISYLEALHFIKQAWSLVTPSCITNCFKKAGFVDSSLENYLELNAEVNFLNVIPEYMDYIHCDDNVDCYGDLNESEIVIKTDLDDESESGLETESVDQIPSLKEALIALDVIQKYCFSNNIDLSLDQIETQLLRKAINQEVYNDPLDSI